MKKIKPKKRPKGYSRRYERNRKRDAIKEARRLVMPYSIVAQFVRPSTRGRRDFYPVDVVFCLVYEMVW